MALKEMYFQLDNILDRQQETLGEESCETLPLKKKTFHVVFPPGWLTGDHFKLVN
jgi:hypothetical protein